jgi:very-short-patch-repair endonuclease
MGNKGTKPPLDVRLLEVAGRQYGVVSQRQLQALGLGRSAITKRVRAGRLTRVHRGVYRTGHAPFTRRGRFLAAVLACGENAVLSHRRAAVLLGLLKGGPAWSEVTVSTQHGRKLAGILVHRSPLPPGDVMVYDGIPVTTPGRTLIDLADVLSTRGLERVFDQAEFLRLDCTALRVIPGRRGALRLASVLAEHRPGTTPTRSELEEAMLALCREAALPAPEVNSHVEEKEVDFVWRERGVIVETDGWRAHGTRRAFERDRLRDAELTAAGWRVLRVTHARLEREPQALTAQLRRLLCGT